MGRFLVCTGALVLALAVGGCKAEQVLSDDQMVQMQQLDEQLASVLQEQRNLESTALATLNQVKNAALAGDKAEALRLMSLANSQVIEFEERAKAAADIQRQQQELLEEGYAEKVESATGIVSSVVSAFFPPAAPYAQYLDALALPLVGLFFKRPRKRLKEAGKNFFKGRLADMAREVGKMFGWAHSNDDPLKVLEGARAAAMAKSDPDTAKKIEEFRTTLAKASA